MSFTRRIVCSGRGALSWLVVALCALWLPASAGACTAVRLSFTDHPAYVAVAIDFVAGTITAGDVATTDPNPVDGTAALIVTRAGIHTRISTGSGLGVTVHVGRRPGQLRIVLRSARGRFKYIGYAVASGSRLVIQLWKSTPPSRGAEIRRGTGGCLTLEHGRVSAGDATAGGRGRGLFENQAQLTLRGRNGRILAQRTVRLRSARWKGRLSYRVSPAQAGTLEVHTAAAKDGSLSCIAQVRVTLPISPPPVAVRVLSRYPQQCLRAVARPGGAGLVATLRDTTLTIASPTGADRVVTQITPPPMGSYLGSTRYLQWSPDGRWVALRWGTLLRPSGAAAGSLFATPALGAWTWSPTSDCVLAVTASSRAETTVSLGVPGQRGRPYLKGRFAAFAFSPNGRRLFLVTTRALAHPRFVELDLLTGHLHDIGPAPGNGCCLSFGGWAPGGKILLFWAGQGASVMADGVQLQGLDAARGNRIVSYGTQTDPAFMLPTPASLAGCGGNLVGVIGVGRTYATVSDKRLALIAPGRAPTYLTPKTAAYLSPSCEPDGTAVAAVRYANGDRITAPAALTAVSVKTGAQHQLTPSAALTDGDPEWTGAGILYDRTPSAGGPEQLWFAAGAAAGQDTGLRATATSGTWDWSATPPSGIGG